MGDSDTFGASGNDLDNLPAFFGGDSEDEENNEVEEARRRFLAVEGLENLPKQGSRGSAVDVPTGTHNHVQEPDSPGSPSFDPETLAGIDSLLDDSAVDAATIESQILRHAQTVKDKVQQSSGWNFNQFAGSFGSTPAPQQHLAQPQPANSMSMRQVPVGMYAPVNAYPQRYQQVMPPQQQFHVPQPQQPGNYGIMPPMNGPMPGYPAQGYYPPPQQFQQQPRPIPSQQIQPRPQSTPVPPVQAHNKLTQHAASSKLQAAPMEWIGEGVAAGLEENSTGLRDIQAEQAHAGTNSNLAIPTPNQQQQIKSAGPHEPHQNQQMRQQAEQELTMLTEQSHQQVNRMNLENYRSDFKYMPWRDLRYVVRSLHRQHYAVGGQTKARFYEVAMARKAAGISDLPTAVSATIASELLADARPPSSGADARAQFAKWSDERSKLWAKTHHTLGSRKKTDITRPPEMLSFEMGDADRNGESFADRYWIARKLVEDAMSHILAIERNLQLISTDTALAGISDPVLKVELENHRSNLSNVLQLRKSADETWNVLACLQMFKGKRMVVRALNALDSVRLGIFLKLIFRDIAHFLFSQDETKESNEVNNFVADTLVTIIKRVELQSLSLLSACFNALVETQTTEILKFYLQTDVSAKVIEELILHGTDLARTAQQIGDTLDPSVQAAVTLWADATDRLTAALQ